MSVIIEGVPEYLSNLLDGIHSCLQHGTKGSKLNFIYF
jgi:hypothetical protein